MLISDKTLMAYDFITNTLVQKYIKLDVKSMLLENKVIIYDAALLVYLHNNKESKSLSWYKIKQLYIQGVVNGEINIIDGMDYNRAISERYEIDSSMNKKAIIGIIKFEYKLKLLNKEKEILFRYANPIEIISYSLANNLKLPDEIVNVYNKIIAGEPLDNNINISVDEMITGISRARGKKKKINERVKDVAEVQIYRELAKKCTCIHTDLARYIAPTVFNNSLHAIRESRKYANKSNEWLLSNPKLRSDVEKWCEEKVKEVFTDPNNIRYPDAKHRVKGLWKNFEPPTECPVKEHRISS
jgi:hypothetical protein